MSEWERQPNEPSMWFGRFDEFYRPMGTERTMLGAYNAWRERAGKGPAKAVSRSWKRQSKAWEWKERAEAWDEQERVRRWNEEEKERLTRRRERRVLLQGLKGKLANLISNVDPENPSVRDVVLLIKEVFEQERAEYDDVPTQRHEVSGPDGGPIQTEDVTISGEQRNRSLSAFAALVADELRGADRAAESDLGS